MDRSHEPTPKEAGIKEVLSAELLEFQVFRYVTSCRPVSSCPTLRRIAVSSVNLHEPARRNIPEDKNLEHRT